MKAKIEQLIAEIEEDLRKLFICNTFTEKGKRIAYQDTLHKLKAIIATEEDKPDC